MILKTALGFFVTCLFIQIALASFAEWRLVKSKLQHSELRHVRPVRNPADVVNVTYGVTLQNIVKLDETERTVTVSLWESFSWNSYYLTWNPLHFDGVRSIRLPVDQMWVPDIRLYNSLGTARLPEADPHKFPAVVSNSGDVILVTPNQLTVRCNQETAAAAAAATDVDTTEEPNESDGDNVQGQGQGQDLDHVQPPVFTCSFKFGSWTYDGSKVDLHLSAENWDVSTFGDGDLYKVFNTTASRNVVEYACCPEKYIDLRFRFSIQRQG